MSRPRAKPAAAKPENQPAESKSRSSDGSNASTDASSASSTEPAGLRLDPGDPFTPPKERPPVADATEPFEPFEAAPPEPIEWTPERAGAIVRAGGFLLHSADPYGSEEGGEELWRATEADCDAIGAPLSRILNRYAPARRLAGVSDEAELAFGMLAYAKRNLSTRGRLVALKREREGVATELEWGPGSPGEKEPPAGTTETTFG